MGGNAKREMYKGVSMGYSIISSSYMIVAIAGYWAFGFNVRPCFPGRMNIHLNSPVHRAFAQEAFSKPARGDDFNRRSEFLCAWPNKGGYNGIVVT